MTEPVSASGAHRTSPYDPAVGSGAEAAALIAEHTAYGVVQTDGLAQALATRTQSDPEGAEQLTEEIEAQLSPVDRAALVRDMEALPPAGSDGEEGFGAFVDGAVRGDYSDNDSWSRIGGQTLVGFIPVVGQIADARDTFAAAQGVWNGEDGAWGNLGLAAVAWIPGVGDAAKALARGGDKAVAELGEAAVEGAARQGDEAGAAARHADEAAGLNRIVRQVGDNEIAWTVDANGRAVEAQATLREVFTGADRSADEVAAQSRVGRSGVDGDQGGHMIAHRFTRDQGDVNMFPQNGQFNMSAYRTMENEIADWIEAGGEVQFNVKLHDVVDGRPAEVEVFYEVVNPQTGTVIHRQNEFFENAAGQVFDRTPSSQIEQLMRAGE